MKTPSASEQQGFEGRFLSWEQAACSQFRAGRQLLGVWSSILVFLHNSVPQNTAHHMELCVAAALPCLCCAPDTLSLSAHLRLISPVPRALPRFTCAAVSPVSSCVSLVCFAPGVYILKNAEEGSSTLEQKCPRHSLSLTSSFSFKGIVWINERLFIAGTKCSDMPEMSKCYYAPLKGPLFRDRNGNFMPLQWNHKYHFKPCP